MTRSKDIGTRAETAVVNACHAAGLDAVRVALRGMDDHGDVWINNGRAVVEVKAGEQAAYPSWTRLQSWWMEAEQEAARVAACDLAVLVVKRKGSQQAGAWFAYVRIDEFLWATKALEVAAPQVVAMPFGQLLAALAEDDR